MRAHGSFGGEPSALHVFLVKSPELLAKLHVAYLRDWFATAPAVFVLCKDEVLQWVRPGDSHPHGDIDLAIATEHLCLAAAEQGLGTCWVCNFDIPLCREALGLGETLTPVAMVPVGYPSADFTDTGRRRKRMEEILTER